MITFWTECQKVADDYFPSHDQMTIGITTYDAEIRYADHELHRLFQHYQQQGFDEQSLWIITADHGAGVGNHRWWGHGKHIYNEQLRIPLLFYFSSGTGKNQAIETLVENIDVFPTLLELVDCSAAELSAFQGTSLLPLFHEHTNTYSKQYAFSQRRRFDGPAPKKIIPEVTNYEAGDTYALQSEKYKYIHRTAGDDEFFDLKNDPYEMQNLLGKGLPEETVFRRALFHKASELKEKITSQPVQVDDKAIEQLKSLGYTQ